MRPPPQADPGLSQIERERMILRRGIVQDERTVRLSGIVSMVCGFLLIGIIGTVAYYTIPIMLADGETVDGSRFTGGPGARLMIFAIYAAVAAIGFMAMLSGAVHIATGKRFAPGIRLMLGFVSLLVMLGLVARAFL
jgi:hypothetical protein